MTYPIIFCGNCAEPDWRVGPSSRADRSEVERGLMEPNTTLYPVSLVVAGRRCLVVGGGGVAARKVHGLVSCGAAVTVVAPEVHPSIIVLGDRVTVRTRRYETSDIADHQLVIAATGVGAVDSAVARDADRAGVWVNSADDPANCTVLLPAVHRDGPVTIAVSTGGASPALAVWLRRRLAAALVPGTAALAHVLEDARQELRANGRSTESVDWQAALDGVLPELVAAGRIHEAQTLLAEVTVERS